ncbi:unnamed protein product, partial [Ilex paraguariensis]
VQPSGVFSLSSGNNGTQSRSRRTERIEQQVDVTVDGPRGDSVGSSFGHGHWVNSLALSTEYVLRVGAFDHTGKQHSSPDEMKENVLERYKKMKGNALEILVSRSDDFTMFLWEPTVSKHPKT